MGLRVGQGVDVGGDGDGDGVCGGRVPCLALPRRAFPLINLPAVRRAAHSQPPSRIISQDSPLTTTHLSSPYSNLSVLSFPPSHFLSTRLSFKKP